MPSSTTIRNAVAQMMGITGASERVASSVLKKHNYKLDAACDASLDGGRDEIEEEEEECVASTRTKEHTRPAHVEGRNNPIFEQNDEGGKSDRNGD
ncbi:hypothetical protein VF21_04185 [Pseudogymnoascus sp. 05NY08]|nr:hypothetical protein VF21_04185 [Pseudogymnoascus sp. 05NY08]